VSALSALLLGACAVPRAASPSITVLSFNLWHGGDAGGVGVAGLTDVVRASGADLVGVQEGHGFASEEGAPRPDRARELADALGFEYQPLAGRRALLSRWPIVPGSADGLGARVATPHGEVALVCVHAAAAPYQPYQLLWIEYFGGVFLDTADEAVSAARAARGEEIAAALAHVDALPPGLPVLLVGDFNEPSCLDWTPRAVAAGHAPIAVDWPSTRAVLAAGFVDAYRAAHPDEVARRGWTWTPTTAPDDPADRHDRIDFVFVRGARVAGAFVVGESAATSDRVVVPYPSDHRAVGAVVELGGALP
jgi:endonuclease/exonuclease/phosphatase family metal-dependent hydrolase